MPFFSKDFMSVIVVQILHLLNTKKLTVEDEDTELTNTRNPNTSIKTDSRFKGVMPKNSHKIIVLGFYFIIFFY